MEKNYKFWDEEEITDFIENETNIVELMSTTKLDREAFIYAVYNDYDGLEMLFKHSVRGDIDEYGRYPTEEEKEMGYTEDYFEFDEAVDELFDILRDIWDKWSGLNNDLDGRLSYIYRKFGHNPRLLTMATEVLFEISGVENKPVTDEVLLALYGKFGYKVAA